MELQDKVVIVTGGANGIGRALCRRFANESPRGVAVVDLDGAAAGAVADELGVPAVGLEADVAREGDIVEAVRTTEERFGPIDLLVSNAGIGGGGDVFAPDDLWQRIWEVNLMAHVYGAR